MSTKPRIIKKVDINMASLHTVLKNILGLKTEYCSSRYCGIKLYAMKMREMAKGVSRTPPLKKCTMPNMRVTRENTNQMVDIQMSRNGRLFNR